MSTAKLHLPETELCAPPSLPGFGIGGIIRQGLRRVVDGLAERRTRTELDRLSPFHLADIGLERTEGHERFDELGHRPIRRASRSDYRRLLPES
jgi:hypothetical protein